jgi:3-mercaptopyruvate sulfurtransferase SseA
MWKKLILRDAFGMWVLLTGCLLAGIILNETRARPLPLVYSTPQARMEQVVEKLRAAETPSVRQDGDVDLAEMQTIVSNRAALILDARPEIFYRLGHIPSALSLPRDDFEDQYHSLAQLLGTHRDQVLVVYCSGNDCTDSQMVGNALEHLGYPHVRLFRGGWSEWQGGNLPEEKE